MASKKKPSVNPYLILACVMCALAFVLLVSIFLLASASEPASPSKDTPQSGSEASPDHSSAPPETEESTDVSQTPSADTSSESGFEISLPEISEPLPEPEPGVAGPFEQPEETHRYEREIGLCYSVDLNQYEQYIDPADASEYLLLVSPKHPLSADFKPSDLIHIVDIRSDRPDNISYLREYAEKALEAFLQESRAYGIENIRVTNGYRSYAVQSSWFNQYIDQELAAHPSWTREQAYAYVATYCNPPGTSEHQSGLCVDMHNQWVTNNTFDDTPAAIWLAENCYRFGFVLRYPKDKTDVTGIIHESWHFRYVGRTAATEMHELGMCLEEYLEYKGLVS